MLERRVKYFADYEISPAVASNTFSDRNVEACITQKIGFEKLITLQ